MRPGLLPSALQHLSQAFPLKALRLARYPPHTQTHKYKHPRAPPPPHHHPPAALSAHWSLASPARCPSSPPAPLPHSRAAAAPQCQRHLPQTAVRRLRGPTMALRGSSQSRGPHPPPSSLRRSSTGPRDTPESSFLAGGDRRVPPSRLQPPPPPRPSPLPPSVHLPRPLPALLRLRRRRRRPPQQQLQRLQELPWACQ